MKKSATADWNGSMGRKGCWGRDGSDKGLPKRAGRIIRGGVYSTSDWKVAKLGEGGGNGLLRPVS